MRMWCINPILMCDQHLLGEHVECHMLAGSLNKGKNLKGFIDKGLVEVHNIIKRHDALAKEMENRDMRHKSEIKIKSLYTAGKVDMEGNLLELSRRCMDCRKIQNNR